MSSYIRDFRGHFCCLISWFCGHGLWYFLLKLCFSFWLCFFRSPLPMHVWGHPIQQWPPLQRHPVASAFLERTAPFQHVPDVWLVQWIWLQKIPPVRIVMLQLQRNAFLKQLKMIFRPGTLQGGCSTLIITCTPTTNAISLLTFQNGLGGPPPANVRVYYVIGTEMFQPATATLVCNSMGQWTYSGFEAGQPTTVITDAYCLGWFSWSIRYQLIACHLT